MNSYFTSEEAGEELLTVLITASTKLGFFSLLQPYISEAVVHSSSLSGKSEYFLFSKISFKMF